MALRVSGLNWIQRLAFLEGILHWFSAIPRLILLVLPLSMGLLGFLPITLNGAGFLAVFLPCWTSLLMLVSWLNRGSRSALLPEPCGWLLTPVLAGAVVQTMVPPPLEPRFSRHLQNTETPQAAPGLEPGPDHAGAFALNGWNLLGLLVRPAPPARPWSPWSASHKPRESSRGAPSGAARLSADNGGLGHQLHVSDQ